MTPTPELTAMARAMCRAHYNLPDDQHPKNGLWPHFIDSARAALLVIREPSEGMYDALGDKGVVWRDQTSTGVWQTYIDHILGGEA